MQALPHPFFETVYIDPETGLYWEQEETIGAGRTLLVLAISSAQKVTPAALEFAVSTFADTPALDKIARHALATNHTRQPHGVVAIFCRECVAPLAGNTFHQNGTESPPLTLTPESFLEHLHFASISVYPEQEDAPIVLEYSLPPMLPTPQVLRVLFSRQGDPLDVLLGMS